MARAALLLASSLVCAAYASPVPPASSNVVLEANAWLEGVAQGGGFFTFVPNASDPVTNNCLTYNCQSVVLATPCGGRRIPFAFHWYRNDTDRTLRPRGRPSDCLTKTVVGSPLVVAPCNGDGSTQPWAFRYSCDGSNESRHIGTVSDVNGETITYLG